ncbi:MAG TPA: type II CAAX endopeptidase family protein [Actinomycetota bacterium]
MDLPPPPPVDDHDVVVVPGVRGLRGAPSVPWPFWEAVLVYLIGALILGGGAAALLFTISDSSGMAIVGSVVADLVFLGAMLSWLGRRSPDWRDRVRVRFDRGEAVRGFLLGIVLYPAVALVALVVVQWVMERFTGGDVEPPDQLPEGLSPGFKALTVVLVVVIAPVVEELFYRGVLYRSVRDRYGVTWGLVVSSLLFGLAHYVPASAADVLLLQAVMVATGLGLAAIYEWRGSLVANVFAHAAFNAIGVVLIFSSS